MKTPLVAAALVGAAFAGEEGGNQGDHHNQEVTAAVELKNRCEVEGNLALTFDGGPGPATGRLLTKLREMGILATFHLSTAYLDQPRIETFARAAKNDGHTIGLHWNPRQGIAEMTDTDIEKELIAQSEMLHEVTGVYPRYIRLPHNSVDKRLFDILESMSFIPTAPSFDPADYNDRSVQGLVSKYRAQFEYSEPPYLDRFVAIHHDSTDQDFSDAMEAVITLAEELNYTFMTLEDCMEEPFPYKSDAAGLQPLLRKSDPGNGQTNDTGDSGGANAEEPKGDVTVDTFSGARSVSASLLTGFALAVLGWL